MKSAVLFPLLVLVLAGCSRPTVPAAASDQKPAAPVEAPLLALDQGAKLSYVGTWAVADDQGQLFDIVVFPNGQAVSTWTKGSAGAQGERGFWREENGQIVIFFGNGSTSVIAASGDGFLHRGFEPKASLEGAPKNEVPAKRLEGDQTAGIWRLNKEPDGSYLYVALQSSGRAVSTIGGGTEGRWEKTPNGTLCQWPDGWNDLIYASNDGYQKRSWVGPAEQNSTPPDISPALRVGDAKFSVTP